MDFIDICNNPERFNHESRRYGTCEDDREYKEYFKSKVRHTREFMLYDTKVDEIFSKRM